jgi:hypothetical protein
MTIQLKPEERRLVIPRLVQQLLDQDETSYPLPCDLLFPGNAHQIVSDRSGSYSDVATATLTQQQKDYVRTNLELLADLCLQRTAKLTGEKTGAVIERAKQRLQYGNVADVANG